MALCECGCGQITKTVRESGRGYKKGDSLRFIHGHNERGATRSEETKNKIRLANSGENGPNYKGHPDNQRTGYVLTYCPDHPRADRAGYVFVHILVVEKVLGRYLVPPEEVHHWDRNKTNNEHSNLVLCPNRAYYSMLHRRMRAFEATGDPNRLKCLYCKQWDDPENIVETSEQWSHFHHQTCYNEYQRQYRLNRKAKSA